MFNCVLVSYQGGRSVERFARGIRLPESSTFYFNGCMYSDSLYKFHVHIYAVLLEMVNFHNYGDFQGVLVRKNYGEFTMDIMVNFALNRIYSKFYRKCCISDHTPPSLVFIVNLKANILICNHYLCMICYRMRCSKVDVVI